MDPKKNSLSMSRQKGISDLPKQKSNVLVNSGQKLNMGSMVGTGSTSNDATTNAFTYMGPSSVAPLNLQNGTDGLKPHAQYF